MNLTLYYHPLASFCHKVLMALYENDTPSKGEIVDLMDKNASASLFPFKEAIPSRFLESEQRPK